ncbi:MAG: hypothetical protein RR334_03935, partial [Clostridia bacterium]
MKVFKKILQLLFIYIFVTASVATGYIFLVSPYAGGNGDTQTSASKVMDPVVSKMLSNIMLSDTLGVDLSLNVDMADTGSKTEVSVKGSLSLASLLEGKVPDCAFTIVVKGSTSLNCLITIKNSVLFLETAGVKLQINVNNLISEIPELMKLIGVKFDFEMPNLNIDMLNGMMSGLVSTKNENGGYDIPLDLMGMGTLLFKTDEKSNMKSLNLTNLELGGVKVNLVTDIFENPVVEDTTLLPNDYTNVTPLLGFVGNISQFKDAESIKINASVDMPSGNIPINVILNMKTKEVSATAIYNSNSINLVYAGSILYVKINEYCFSIKSESIVNLVAELKKTISSDNELGNFIMQMVSVIKEKIALPSTSIKDIISNIDIIENGNNYVINILGQEIKVCFENGIMSVITNIQNNEIALSAQKTSENICIDNAKYVPIDEVLDAVPSLLKMVTSKAFSGDISLFISGNKTIKANYYINLSNFSVKLMVNYAGKDISITYIDNELYLDILNMKVKCSMQGIQEIINILKTNNIIKDNDFDITNTLNKLKEYKLLSATR